MKEIARELPVLKEKKDVKGIFEQLYQNGLQDPKPELKHAANIIWGEGNPVPKKKPKFNAPIEEVEDKNMNPQNYNVEGHLPEYVLNKNGKYYPVYDFVNVRHKFALTEYHYKIDIKITNKLYIFTTEDGRKIHPCHDKVFGFLYFRDPNTGITCVNHFQQPDVFKVKEAFRDTSGQHWCYESDLFEHRLNAGGPVPDMAENYPMPRANNRKPKKKLRKKYQEMPKIKEAKYYESNDYIA